MKKSFMNKKNIISEGFFSAIAKFLRSKPKKMDRKTKAAILNKGMKGEIKSLNSSIDKLEQIVKDTYGDEYPELPRFKATDFL